LAGPNCAVIPTANVALYREHYVTIQRPSNDGDGGAQTGIYPDALIPFRNPFTGQPIQGGQYAPAPFDVPPGQNQPLYVEVYVPPGPPAGVYKGLILLTRDGGAPLAVVPFAVTVWGFDLPAAPSLRSAFHNYDAEHFLGPGAYYGYNYRSPQH